VRLLAYLAIGGALGTVARYGLSGLVQSPATAFPWGTLAVNVLGSFALGFLMRYLLGSTVVTPELRVALTVGFCGGFTTMSTFSYETIAMVQEGDLWRVIGYVAGTLGGSMGGVVLGLVTAGRFL